MNAIDLTPETIDTIEITVPSGEIVRIGPALSLHHIRPRNENLNEETAALLQKFLDFAGDRIHWVGIDENHSQPVAKIDVKTLPDRVRESPLYQACNISIHGGDSRKDAHTLFFRIRIPPEWEPVPRSYMAMGFPMRLMADRGTGLLDWASIACSIFNPFHGTGGFTITTNFYWSYASDVMGSIADILHRLPGLDYPAGPTGGHVVREGPVTANWLTILDDSLVSQMGGRGIIIQAMKDLGGDSRTWDNGMILVAPGLPQIGDREAGLFPQSYTEVGRMIAALLANREANYFMGAQDRDMRAFSAEWRTRFDG